MIASLVPRRHRGVVRRSAREPRVDGRRAPFGVLERVADALCCDRILVVARVTYERPTRAERRTEEAWNRSAKEWFDARRAGNPLGERRSQLQGREEVRLDIGLVGRRLRVGPTGNDHGQPVVGGRGGEAAVRADVDLHPIGREVPEVGVVAVLESRLGFVLRGLDRLGEVAVLPVSADHDPALRVDPLAIVAVAGDPQHGAVLDQEPVDIESHQHLDTRRPGRFDEDLVQNGPTWCVAGCTSLNRPGGASDRERPEVV